MRRRHTTLHLNVSPSSRSGVGLRSERGPVLLALMVSTGLIAIDATILATAVPSIVRDVGGFAQFPWLFSVYLLAQAVSVSVYAKLADTVGRKPIILLGIGLFLVGSVLCGVAWSMPALIAFRAVQGLGAGAVAPIAITIAGDIYTVAERATAQGYIASVWAMSSVIGPTLGGVFAQLGLWRWIFLVNVPLCLLAGGLIMRNFHETVERREHHVDYLGAVMLTSGMTLAILGVLEGGQAWAWSSPTSIAVFAAGAALLGAFVLVERRAAEPILPPWVLRRRLLATTTALALGVGVILIGLTSYVPTYLQGALGVPPVVAGLALAALTIGWPIAATLSGRLFYMRFGFRPTVLIGLGLAVLGTGSLALLAHRPSVARGRGDMLRHRPGDGPRRLPLADRRPGQRRVARARGGHGGEHVRPFHRQRGRCRRPRCRRERGHRGVRTRRDRPGRRDGRRCGGVPRRSRGRRPHRRGRAAHAEGGRRGGAGTGGIRRGRAADARLTGRHTLARTVTAAAPGVTAAPGV